MGKKVFSDPRYQRVLDQTLAELTPGKSGYFDSGYAAIDQYLKQPFTVIEKPPKQKKKAGLFASNGAVRGPHAFDSHGANTDYGAVWQDIQNSQNPPAGGQFAAGGRYAPNYAELQRNNAKINVLGGQTEHTNKIKSFGMHVLDYLSRPMLGLEGGVYNAVKRAQSGKNIIGTPDNNIFTEFGKGAAKGFTKRGPIHTGADIVTELTGSHNSKLRGIGGFATDVLYDPLTFLGGLGTVAKGKDVAAQAAKAQTLSKTVDDIAKGTLSKYAPKGATPVSLPTNLFDKITGKQLIQGRQSAKAFAGAQGNAQNVVEDLIKRAAQNRSAAVLEQLTNDAVKAEHAAGRSVGASARQKLIVGLKDQAAKAGEDYGNELRQRFVTHYDALARSNVRKGIGLNIAGKSIGGPIPGTTEALGALSKALAPAGDRAINRSIKAFQKAFSTSTRQFPEGNVLRQEHIGAGLARAHERMNEIHAQFKVPGIHNSDLHEAWDSVLHTPPSQIATSASRVPDLATGLPTDTATVMQQRLNDVADRIYGTGRYEGLDPISAQELNRNLPPGLGAKFAELAKGDWVRGSIRNWDNGKGNLKNGANALYLLESAIERVSARRALDHALVSGFGVRPTQAISEQMVNQLKDKGYRTITGGSPVLHDVLFHPEIADAVTKINKLMDDERNMGAFVRGMSKITNPIKFIFTIPNPGFHLRNSMGDIFVNYLDGMNPAKPVVIQSYNQSAKILFQRKHFIGGDIRQFFKPNTKFGPHVDANGVRQPGLVMSGSEVLGTDLLEQAKNFRGATPLFKNSTGMRLPDGSRPGMITDSEIWAGANKYGIRQNYALGEFDAWGAGNPVAGAAGSAKARVLQASELREDYFRMAHFIYLVRTNPTKARNLDAAMEWAAGRVRKMHFDYTDFTKFEKQIMSNIIPFYKWTRKALPLMTEQMFLQPGKAMMATKFQRNLSTALGYSPQDPSNQWPGLNDQFVPQWMKEMGAVPVAGNMLFNVSNPFNDLLNNTVSPVFDPAINKGNPLELPTGAFQTFGSMVNPIFKAPYEVATNRQVFNGQPIRNPKYGTSTQAKQLLQYFANYFPYFRTTTNTMGIGPSPSANATVDQQGNPITPPNKSRIDSFLTQMSPFYFYQVTPARQVSEMERQKDVSRAILQHYEQELKRAGIDPNTLYEPYGFNQSPPALKPAEKKKRTTIYQSGVR